MAQFYEWDEQKRQTNLEKHGLDFVDAWQVIENESSVTFEDIKHSQNERRQITVGYMTGNILCAVVVHTDRHGVIRIISFRRANKKERALL